VERVTVPEIAKSMQGWRVTCTAARIARAGQNGRSHVLASVGGHSVLGITIEIQGSQSARVTYVGSALSPQPHAVPFTVMYPTSSPEEP
jgi:hypothetical protein